LTRVITHIPEETVGRLLTYLRVLLCVTEQGVETVSSHDLDDCCDVRPGVIRKGLEGSDRRNLELGRRLRGLPGAAANEAASWPQADHRSERHEGDIA